MKTIKSGNISHQPSKGIEDLPCKIIIEISKIAQTYILRDLIYETPYPLAPDQKLVFLLERPSFRE